MLDSLVETAVGNGVILTAVAAVSLILLAQTLLKRNQLSHIPSYEVNGDGKTAGKNQYPSTSSALREAYPKFRDTVFMLRGLWTPLVIVPPKFVESLKALPENQLSFLDATTDRFFNHLTTTNIEERGGTAAFLKSVSVDLTRHISKVMADLDDEIAFAFQNCIPASDDWSEVYPAQVLTQIVALASGRIFVGNPLNRDPEFLRCTITFTIESFMASEALRKYPSFLRPLAARWIPEIQRCREVHTTMRKLMEPLVKERVEEAKRGEEPKNDMVSWMIQNSPPEIKYSVKYQAHAQLAVSLAAIHTTTMQTSHAFFDLAAHPECIEPLRKEWEEVLATEPDGVISKSSMPKLKKLDSFLKESQRINPLGITTFERKVNSDITLPDGTKLPKGSYLAAPTNGIARDAALWENPDEFDGFRFDKLRKQPGSENRHQFVTTGIDSLHFGHGKHACPGRFFAANEIKLIMAYLINHYDIKYPEGQTRPDNIEGPAGCRPDHTKAILVKRRAA